MHVPIFLNRLFSFHTWNFNSTMTIKIHLHIQIIFVVKSHENTDNKRLKIHSNGFLFKMFHSLDDQLWQNSRLFFLLFGSCFSFWNHSEYLFRYFIQLSFYLVQNRVDLSLVIQVDLKMKRKIELMIKLITKNT